MLVDTYSPDMLVALVLGRVGYIIIPLCGGEVALFDGSDVGEWPALCETALALDGGVKAGVPLWLDCEDALAI